MDAVRVGETESHLDKPWATLAIDADRLKDEAEQGLTEGVGDENILRPMGRGMSWGSRQEREKAEIKCHRAVILSLQSVSKS